MANPHVAPERTPWVVEHRSHEQGRSRTLDVQLRVAFSGTEDQDPEALRRHALQELKRIVAALEEEKWAQQATLTGGQVKGRTVTEGPFHVPASQRRPPRPTLKWRPPKLPPAKLALCHDILEGLLLLGVHGRAVPIGDLHKKRSIPQAKLYAALKEGSATQAYLSQYVEERRSGGKRLLDLTPEGRILASQIRAGELPVPEAR